MEQNKGALVLVLVCLVFGSMVGHSTASFKKCYGICFLKCMLIPPFSPFFCAPMCLKDCIFHKNLDNFQTDVSEFCKLGCATSLCTKISTKENPSKSLALLLFLFMCLCLLHVPLI